MAGIKISALPSASAAQLTDMVPAVQAGATVRETWSQVITLFNSNIVLSSTAQVTGLSAALASFLPLAGGTMSGTLILNTNSPTVALEAASKGYVDTVASGFTVVLACLGATTANLNATYANGAAGVGATLTDAAGTFAAFTVDGLSPALNSRILVKNQTTTFQNGIYTLTTNGDGISIPYVLTRATDYNQAPSEIHPGTLIAINSGTANATTSWLETATVTTIGTDPILFSQFTFAPSAFLLSANNLSDVANAATSRTNLGLTAAATMTLPVSGTNGGTGINNGASTITIGGDVAFSGAFTFAGTITANTAITFPTSGTLLTSSQPTINQPNIVGVTTNSNAAAGSVGEFVSSVILAASAVSLVTNTAKNVTTILLTAGDWDVWGNTCLDGGTANITEARGWTNTASATIPDGALQSGQNSNLTGFSFVRETVPYQRISISINTTIYLSCLAKFASSTVNAYGGIYARRVR